MANLENYRQYIQTILQEHSQFKPKYDEIDNELIFDTINDHYQLMYIGWNDLKRVYYSIIHFDIKDNKIWIQQNTTETDLAEQLVNMGVPKEDIIFGLQPPYKRPYTGYGVA